LEEYILTKVLSVIIPTYNVEKYLDNCLESFICPDILDDYEVIVVNDGSTDKSEKIASGFASKYPNTYKVYTKSNGGHGSTINYGIEMANGKYVKVVDSDDWVDTDGFRKLVKFLKTADQDMVITNFYWIDNRTLKKKVELKKPFSDVIYGRTYHFSEIADDAYFKMHNMTVKLEILKKIPKIDEHCYYVDLEYIFYPVPYIDTLVCFDYFVYMYRVGLPNQSMALDRMEKNVNNYETVFSSLLRYYDHLNTNEIGNYYKDYLIGLLSRAATSRIKIYLAFPYNKTIIDRLRKFDQSLNLKYPQVYKKMDNKAVLLLRKTNYKAYFIEHLALLLKEKIS
jgi:glycosyltransferase involved in cell wall biosynthesis